KKSLQVFGGTYKLYFIKYQGLTPCTLHLPAAGRSSANSTLAGFRFQIRVVEKIQFIKIGSDLG
ncbi:MAG: hypothetical protein OCU18_08895, partial [Candidatus Syntrophoarchaeum sp.]|nr:hypothetical protein [Candidatus Syntrophoarchaeum sp.]